MRSGSSGPRKPTILDVAPDQAAARIIDSWFGVFERLGWPERLELLLEIDEQIRNDLREPLVSRAISEQATAILLEKLPPEPVRCDEQAFIYLHSSNQFHRQIGLVWLAIRPNSSSGGDLAPTGGHSDLQLEKRSVARHGVDLEITLSKADQKDEDGQTGRLVDVSVRGARASVDGPAERGEQVWLRIPMIEPIGASVVWRRTSEVGLAFAGDPAEPPLSEPASVRGTARLN